MTFSRMKPGILSPTGEPMRFSPLLPPSLTQNIPIRLGLTQMST
jgi:hypothetical protein